MHWTDRLAIAASVASAGSLGNMLKEPTHIQAHLVFADTQSQNKKPKELEFLPKFDK